MATVYLAEDPLLNRLVAIKVIQAHLSTNDKLIERFNVEAKTIAALRHANIVEIFDFGVQDNQQYLVMEFIDGQSLQTLCTALAGKPMPDTVTAAIILQAAEGLTVAEKQGVIHRDIKPENLLFNTEGALKITDFGIAHIADEHSRTQTGAVLGSPNFMSPEQVEGLKPTPKTDVFALGGVFYSCLTGMMPFTGGSIPATLRNICEKPHVPVADLNPKADPFLIQIVDTLLQKNPADRGAGARWVAQQLKSWLGMRGIADSVDHVREFIVGLNIPPPPTLSGSLSGNRFSGFSSSTLKRFKSRRILWLTLSALVSLAVLVGGAWLTGLMPVGLKNQMAPKRIAATSKTMVEKDSVKTVSAASGTAKKVKKSMAPNPMEGLDGRNGYLMVQSAPPFAAININGKPEGETPMKSWLELPPGKYHVELLHRIAPPFDTDITVGPGAHLKFKFKLER